MYPKADGPLLLLQVSHCKWKSWGGTLKLENSLTPSSVRLLITGKSCLLWPHVATEKPSPVSELRTGAWVVCGGGERRSVWAGRDHITAALSPSPRHSCWCQDPFPALPRFEKNVKSALIGLKPVITYDSSDQKQGPLTALVFNACIHLWVEGSLSVWLMSSQHIPLTKNMKRFDFFPLCDCQHKHIVKSTEQMVRHLGKSATFKEVTGLQWILKLPRVVIERRLSFISRVRWSEKQSLFAS